MKLIFRSTLIILTIAGALWWFWTTTPQYAVQQAAKAISEHDVAGFHQWVNVEELSGSAIDDLLSEPARALGGTGIMEKLIGYSLLSMFKPAILQTVDQQIDSWITHTSNPTNDHTAPNEPSGSLLGAIVSMVKPPQLKPLLRQYGFTKQNYRGLGPVDVKDKFAHVTLLFFNAKLNDNIPVILELNYAGKQWQITKISNLKEILATIAHIES